MEDFVTERYVLRKLTFAAKKFESDLDLMNVCFLGKMALSKELLIGLSDHIATLLPLYEAAKKEHNWSLFAGMVVRSDQPEYEYELDVLKKRKYNDLKGCLQFTGEVLKSMLGSRLCLGDLVRFSGTSTFTFDSLYDIVFILRHSVNKLLFDKGGPLGTRAHSLFNGLVDREKQQGQYFDAWGYWLVESCSAGSRFLRKSKYDQLRREVLSMMVQQQHLADLYADFYKCYVQQKQLHGAPSGKDEDIERYTTRFVTINELCYQLYMVTNIIFDYSLPPVATLTLLRHVSILKVDLDVAQEYYNISSKMLKGRCKSPEQTRSIAWWSFGLVVQTMAPIFLQRFAVEEELKRLIVIDKLGSDVLGTQKEILESKTKLEAIAFELVQCLLRLGDNPYPETSLKTIIEGLLGGNKNKNWVRVQTKRFGKKIETLRKESLRQREKLQRCLDCRKKHFDVLLNKLQAWNLKRRLVPENITHRLTNNEEEVHMESLTEIGKVIHQWSLSDAREFGESLLCLEEAGETITTFVHYATNHQYPVVKSITNPLWSQRQVQSVSDLSGEHDEIKCITDMVSICDILLSRY